MLVYTVHGTRSTQTFGGITRAPCGGIQAPPTGARFLGQVSVRDTPEFWWLENSGWAVESLQRYYVKTYKRRVEIKLFAQVGE